MVRRPRIFVQCSVPSFEKAMARILGRDAAALSNWALQLAEADLECFPTKEMVSSLEENVAILDSERKNPSWKALFDRVALIEGVDRKKLEVLACQKYCLELGRPLAQLRQLIAICDSDERILIATDLPKNLLSKFLSSRSNRIYVISWASSILRFVSVLKYLVKILGLHLFSLIRLVNLYRLPSRPYGTTKAYVAWLNANEAELAHLGDDNFSILEFLSESMNRSDISEIVIQSSTYPSALPENVIYRRFRAALRYRPSFMQHMQAIAKQFRRMLVDIFCWHDWRQLMLISELTLDFAAWRLWISDDPPTAVIYANSVIGGEPSITLLSQYSNFKTMMLFYSANVGYYHEPVIRSSSIMLEPEIRYIAADKIGMWSVEMQDSFVQAGYSRKDLPILGVIHFAKQFGFRPNSCFLTGRRKAKIRIGVFDVSPQLPSRRFFAGWGQTLYYPIYCKNFFDDIVNNAKALWGEEFVLVRKAKRPHILGWHDKDIDLSSILPLEQLEILSSNTSLWKILNDIDLVVCMPFTSVTYMAEQYGIPSAYYDPSSSVMRSCLAGRAPLLSSEAELISWFRAPVVQSPHDPSIIVAHEALSAACGYSWQTPTLIG